jgi:membrane protein DedA with SNARE-associated domain
MSRLPFAIFRLYAAVVSAGIGSVFGWAIGWWMMSRSLDGRVSLLVWGVCMVALVAGFGVAAYKGARGLRV